MYGLPLNFIALTKTDIGLHMVFIPFMVGTISLIAFLSLRNTYLAGRSRDLCEKIRVNDDVILKASYFLQLSYFIRRYKISNLALIFSIVAVFFFGLMIACHVFFDGDKLVLRMPYLSEFMLLLGGTIATAATGLSIYETYIARRSLFAEVAATIITCNYQSVTPNLNSILKKLKHTIIRNLDTNLHKLLDEKLESLSELVESDSENTKDSENTDTKQQ